VGGILLEGIYGHGPMVDLSQAIQISYQEIIMKFIKNPRYSLEISDDLRWIWSNLSGWRGKYKFNLPYILAELILGWW
jgi:hypothetical protein